MWPFLADGSLIAVVASATSPVRGMELLLELEVATVQQLQAPEILLALRLNSPEYRVYMDLTLFDHDEVLVCLDPPLGYGATTPHALSALLQATPISLG
jgi:hypothetical protein